MKTRDRPCEAKPPEELMQSALESRVASVPAQLFTGSLHEAWRKRDLHSIFPSTRPAGNRYHLLDICDAAAKNDSAHYGFNRGPYRAPRQQSNRWTEAPCAPAGVGHMARGHVGRWVRSGLLARPLTQYDALHTRANREGAAGTRL